MTTIVRAAGAAGFLSLIPAMMGFTPTQSLVLVPFAGSRSAGGMRIDLPDAGGGGSAADGLDAFASTAIGMVCRVPETDGVALVVYSDGPFADGRPPAGDLVTALLSRADACGLRVVDALCVGTEAWGSYLDAECPPSGWPLAALAQTAPAHLPPPVGDQRTGADLEPADEDTRARVAGAVADLEVSMRMLPREGHPSSGGTRVDPRALAAAERLDDLPALFEDALGDPPARMDAFLAAPLLWCLNRPALRDVALVQWCGGFAAGDEAMHAQARWERGEPYPEHLGMRMWGDGPRPDPDRLAGALALVRRLAALAPRELQPGPLAICAWLSWALGRSTHAERYAQAAREIDAQHRLSEIVLTFVAAGHLPDWAFRHPDGEPR